MIKSGFTITENTTGIERPVRGQTMGSSLTIREKHPKKRGVWGVHGFQVREVL